MKRKLLAVVMGVLGFGLFMVMTGCITTTGPTGDTGQTGKLWTYNLQQALARSAGDVAMTMTLDQGVNKAAAVKLTNELILFIQSSDLTLIVLNAKIADIAVTSPQFAKFLDKLNSAIPLGLGKSSTISPEVKAVLLSFLQDGALYGATMYKDGMQLKVVQANQALKINP